MAKLDLAQPRQKSQKTEDDEENAETSQVTVVHCPPTAGPWPRPRRARPRRGAGARVDVRRKPGASPAHLPRGSATHISLRLRQGRRGDQLAGAASGIDYPLDEEQLGEYYTSMAAMGINAGKLKIGLDLETDMRRIRIMRDALATSGKPPELILDVNEYWSPKQSIRYMHTIESEFDITWLEEPARRWDVEGLKQVSEGIRAAVSSGENLQTVEDLAPLLVNRAIDVLNLNKSFSGFSGAMRAAHLAAAVEIPCSGMNCWGNAIAHLCASLDNHWMMEVLNAGESLLFSHVHPIVDGYVVLNDEPGLGYTIDEAKLAEYAVEQASPTARPSPFGRRQGAALFLVPPEATLVTPEVEEFLQSQADAAPRVGQLPRL